MIENVDLESDKKYSGDGNLVRNKREKMVDQR